MVSRENAVYLVAAACAVVLLLLTLQFDATQPDWLWGLVILGYYALGVGAGHLYLARTGEAGEITVGSRWRFLLALGCWLALGGLALLGPDGRVRGVGVDAVLTALGGVVLVGYWLFEARDGYLATRPS